MPARQGEGLLLSLPAERVGRVAVSKRRSVGHGAIEAVTVKVNFDPHPRLAFRSPTLPTRGSHRGDNRGSGGRDIKRHGSLTNLKRPTAFSVCASKVRISIAPPMSSVTTTVLPAMPVETIFADFGRTAVISAALTLPSALKRR